MKFASFGPILFHHYILQPNEKPPDSLLDDDLIGVNAEVTLSLAEPYDIELARLGSEGLRPSAVLGRSEGFCLGKWCTFSRVSGTKLGLEGN